VTGIIRAPRPKKDYFDVRNETVRDVRLSYRARGILIRLLSNADGFRMTAEDLARQGKEGRGAVLTALRELRKTGYMRTIKTQDKRGKWTTATYVYDTPQSTEVGKPDAGKPHSGPPDAGSLDSIKNNQHKNHKAACTPEVAAAVNKSNLNSHHPQEKTRRQRPSGLITWTHDDVIAAEKLESTTPPDVLKTAIEAVLARGKQPVPGLVEEQVLALSNATARSKHQNLLNLRSRASTARGEIKGLEQLLAATDSAEAAASLYAQIARAQAKLAEAEQLLVTRASEAT
jgi:hypothetical protein